MSSWNTNVLPFEPVFYCQAPTNARHVPVHATGYAGYYHPTRDIVTSVCDVMSTFLKHPLSETIVKPKSQSIADIIPKVIENEKLLEHIQGAFQAIRAAYENAPSSGEARSAQPSQAVHPTRCETSDARPYNLANLDTYPQRLLLTFQCDWATDGVAILHVDPSKPAILTIAINKPNVRIIEIEQIICCDMDVYVSHRATNKRCFIYLDQVNEVDLVDRLEIHMTALVESAPRSYVLSLTSST